MNCRDLFGSEDKAVLDFTIRRLLADSRVDVNRRTVRKFLERLPQQSQLGRLEVGWLANQVAKDQIKRERRESLQGVERWIQPFSPSALLDQFIREQTLEHGYIKTLQKAGLLRESTDIEKFRLVLRRYDVVYLVESLILTIPVAVIHGPLSFSVGLSLAGTPLPLMRSRPIPPEILNEAIEKGIPAVRHRLEEIYGSRARVEAVQRVLEIAVWALFFASAAAFIDEYFPWIRFAVQSAFFVPTEAEIERVYKRLGLEHRVEIQVNSWADAYREFNGQSPPAPELERKRREFRGVLSHL